MEHRPDDEHRKPRVCVFLFYRKRKESWYFTASAPLCFNGNLLSLCTPDKRVQPERNEIMVKNSKSPTAKKTPELYDSRFEHDNCGIGAVANMKGVKSHKTVEQALHIVENLEHRAGKDAEGKTGDGVGIMLQISHKFFKKVTKSLGIEIGGEREYGVGMFFFPQDELARNQAKKMFEIIVKKEGLEFLGWRDVETHPELIGERAVDCMPCIAQGFVKKPADTEKGLDFDRKLYVSRRVFEQSNDNTYVV